MGKRLFVVFLLFGIQQVFGWARLSAFITRPQCASPAGGQTEYVFSYTNPNPFPVPLIYGGPFFKIYYEDSKGSSIVRNGDLGLAEFLPYSFLPGTHVIGSFKRPLVAGQPAKPFRVRFILDQDVEVKDICNAIRPTLTGVTANCTYFTAHFGYENSSSYTQTLPSPADTNNLWNYFTDRSGKRVVPTFVNTVFNSGSNPDCYDVTFRGSEITWHLTTGSITATASAATNLISCVGDFWDTPAPMDDFKYRPYPVLLVHGYNATPVTWGAVTSKGNNKDTLLVATKLNTYTSADDESKFAENLAEKIYGSADSLFKDYKANTGYFDSLPPQRYRPYEEWGSYTDSNHTFVEHYCASYAFESDDGSGQFDRFAPPADFTGTCTASPYPCYYLGRYNNLISVGGSPYGGQTQLIRIRIVQVLNEYYGDWKWLHDPTAKINIIVHSNGGLAVTNALKNDSIFYNGGSSVDYSYNINGLGVRLNDHINLVQTVDSPFDGSPLAGTDYGVNSKYSKFEYTATRLLYEAVPELLGASGFNRCDPASFAIGKFLVTPLVQQLINENLIQSLAGTGTPVFSSMVPNSEFLKSLKGDGVAPAFSSQSDYTWFSQEPGKKYLMSTTSA